MLRSRALGPIFLLFFRLSFPFPDRYVLIGSHDPAFLPGNLLFPLVWTSLLSSSLGKSVTPIVRDSIVL